MVDKFDYRPGDYRILVSRLLVRGTPDTSHNGNIVLDTGGNQLRLQLGQAVPVYRVQTTKTGWVWGVISNSTADRDHFICLWDLKTRYAELVKPFNEYETDNTFDMMIMKHEQELERLKEWARTQGYTG